MYQQPNHALTANIGAMNGTANQAAANNALGANAAAMNGGVHPLVAALMQHLGNMNGTPQTAPAGTPAGNGLTVGGGINPNPGHMNGTPVMGGGLPGVSMGAVANQYAPTAQNATNNGTAAQQAAGMAGKLGGVSGTPMGAYGSFYGPMANQAGQANQAAGNLAAKAAGMGAGMRMQGGG